MTVQTNTTIEFSDISGIEFECSQCHTKTIVDPTKFKHPQIHCTLCKDGKQWVIPGSRDMEDLVTLGRVIQWLSGADQPEAFTVRLHIKQSSASGRASNGQS